ncbi:MAG: sodium:solute symporter [Flavobacteriales bacterium]|nr:sodium:solute symporter [Flavobacteriales bacterium]
MSQSEKWWIIIVLFAYFALLLVVSYFTSKKANNQSFFQANKSAPWYLVAFGMVGTSLSGVTFISVPGTVGAQHFWYFQVVIGYLIGYFVVAFVLLPLYYRYNLTSIYNYLDERLGRFSYKTGALFFILSRTLGATLRLYIVINVLQYTIMDDFGVPFAITAMVILIMILLYTYKGGVKTIVWTDTLQTFFMLLALVVCVGYILNSLDLSFSAALSAMTGEGMTEVFNTDPSGPKYFLKQILGGAFVTITMTGLDQEMMQKNISVKTLGDSQKNMITFSFVLVAVNFLFLMLGGLLYLFAAHEGLAQTGDDLFPAVAMDYLPAVVSVIFIVGLISALFPSADGAITALTASFCIDMLGMQRDQAKSEAQKTRLRKLVHLAFTAVFLVFVLIFRVINDKNIIDFLLYIANFTYGPLLGLFAFGILTKRTLIDHFVPFICVVAPMITLLLDKTSVTWFNGYRFGQELLLLNGFLTFIGLLILSKRTNYAPNVK